MNMGWWSGVSVLLGCMLFPAATLPLFKSDSVRVDTVLSQAEKCTLCIVSLSVRTFCPIMHLSINLQLRFNIVWMQDAVKIIQDALDSNHTLKDVFPLIEKICVDVMEKEFDSAKYMCPGLIYSYGPVVSRCWDIFRIRGQMALKGYY